MEIALAFLERFKRFLANLDRVIAWGKGETYVRLYPNPGIGIRLLPNWRLALSWHGGLELFVRKVKAARPETAFRVVDSTAETPAVRTFPARNEFVWWQRRWSLFSRVSRPTAIK